MEKIEKSLFPKEEILWKDIRNKNIFVGSNVLTWWIVIHTIFTMGFFVVSMFVEALKEFSFFIYVFYAVLTGFFLIIMLLVNRQLKSYGLPREELKNYQEVYAITNKRWIQKDCQFNSKIDPLNYPDDAVEKTEDVVLVSWKSIQSVSVFQARNIFNIGFYFNKEPESSTYLGLDIVGRVEYEEFLKSLKSQVPLGKEIKDEYGGITYQRI